MIRLGRNTGIINLARNTGLLEFRTPFVFLTDNDITFQPESLRRLRDVADSSADVAIVTPRLLDSERPDTLFYDGNRLHFPGLSRASRRGRSALPPSDPSPRPTFGGGIMLIRASIGRGLGWMDTRYVPGWGSDADFQLRARLHGFQALHDPLAVMTHVGKVHGTPRVAADHELMEGGAFELPRFISGNRALRAAARGVEAALEANWSLCAWASRRRNRSAHADRNEPVALQSDNVLVSRDEVPDRQAGAASGHGASVDHVA